MEQSKPYRRDLAKTFSFLALHFVVGFSVAYAFTGEIGISSGIALVEPLVNAVVFFFHERAWRKDFSWLDLLVHRCAPESEFGPRVDASDEPGHQAGGGSIAHSAPQPSPTPSQS